MRDIFYDSVIGTTYDNDSIIQAHINFISKGHRFLFFDNESKSVMVSTSQNSNRSSFGYSL